MYYIHPGPAWMVTLHLMVQMKGRFLTIPLQRISMSLLDIYTCTQKTTTYSGHTITVTISTTLGIMSTNIIP
jgi:hypothetical protein